jgi:hypothetical protein
MDISLILKDNDPNLHGSFTPYQTLLERMNDDPALPQEFRKLLNTPEAEKQNMRFAVYDAKSSKEKQQLDEVQIKYLRAKWDHYLDLKLS